MPDIGRPRSGKRFPEDYKVGVYDERVVFVPTRSGPHLGVDFSSGIGPPDENVVTIRIGNESVTVYAQHIQEALDKLQEVWKE